MEALFVHSPVYGWKRALGGTPAGPHEAQSSNQIACEVLFVTQGRRSSGVQEKSWDGILAPSTTRRQAQGTIFGGTLNKSLHRFWDKIQRRK